MRSPVRSLVNLGVVIAIVGSGFLGHGIGRPHAVITRAALEVDDESTRYVGKLGISCGVESWATKTMTDPEAANVDLVPHVTTIAVLDAPAGVPGQRVSPPSALTLNGTVLTAYKLEPDSDIHLVLQSPRTGQTMIAEIPNPMCATNSHVLAGITSAWVDFVSEVGAPQSFFVNVHDVIRLTGVGFYDYAHGQRGVAPNAVELHPVIAFRKLSR